MGALEDLLSSLTKSGSGWAVNAVTSITLPTGGLPDTARIVIGTDIPATLQGPYTAIGKPIIAAIISYRGGPFGDSDYTYLAQSSNGEFFIGQVSFFSGVGENINFTNPGFLGISDLYHDPGYNRAFDNWINFTYVNGWSDLGAPFTLGQYRRIASPPFSLQITGALHAGTIAAGTVVTNIPSPYRPNTDHVFSVSDFTSATGIRRMRFSSNGDLSIPDAYPVGGNVFIDVIIPLDAQ